MKWPSLPTIINSREKVCLIKRYAYEYENTSKDFWNAIK